MSQNQSTTTTIDVRRIIPRERHPLIFQTFHGLAKQESFELVNDHDPKPLYYQFAAEYSGKFSWDYLEQGPEIWRVRIGKTADTQAAAAAGKPSRGCCG